MTYEEYIALSEEEQLAAGVQSMIRMLLVQGRTLVRLSDVDPRQGNPSAEEIVLEPLASWDASVSDIRSVSGARTYRVDKSGLTRNAWEQSVPRSGLHGRFVERAAAMSLKPKKIAPANGTVKRSP
ncbi:hypothetical protein [Jannaschia sp. LMIT008]|uniref:hypothetical protein n=1 Tax=Jannaschia maritima TaxID=3032585 RepID=UPI0028117431|nr:hypothetical protein [Jannaschia sp. LMIT008]